MALPDLHTASTTADARLPSEDDIAAVIAWLRDEVPASPLGSWYIVPGLRNVRCTHVEDGWVQLEFRDWSVSAARAVADRLLHPDALRVTAPADGLLASHGPAFEGFGWDDDPPAAVLARPRRQPGPMGGEQPPLSARAGAVTGPVAPTPALDGDDDLL